MADSSAEKAEAPVPSFLTRFLATAGFSGYSPVASGTAGSLVGLLIYLIPGCERVMVLVTLIVVFFIIGVITSSRMEKFYGKDPSIVVIDEVVGMWISLLLFPKSVLLMCLAFVLFRVYDIIKPPPARQIDTLEGGVWIMVDDVVAAVYANVSVRIIGLIFPVILGS